MDIIYMVILIYVVIIFGIALFFSRKESLQEYFLNNKSSGIWLLTFSNVATVIGAGAVLSTMAATYHSGISFGISDIIAFLLGAIILGIIAKRISKFSHEHQIYSIVDFFQKRFDQKNAVLIIMIQLLLLMTRTAVQIVGISYLISTLAEINYYMALGISAGITIAYTAIGGLKIDIITDFIQFWTVFIVILFLAFFGYQHIGGMHNLISNLPTGHLNIFNFGGIGFFIGAIVFGGLIFIPNTCHWQRILSAKNGSTASKSFYRSIPFLLFLMVIIIFLGLIASISIKGIDPNTAIFSLIQKIMPNKVLTGLGFACILAAIMSSLNSLLVGGSTIIYKNIIPQDNISEKKGILRARLLTAGFGIICITIAMCLPDIITLTLFCSYLALILVPSIIAGFYTSKFSANASFYSILVPTILLLSLYRIIGKNTFMISTPLAISIVLFYDKIPRNKKNP